jgi:hypothetical protein
VLFWLIVLIATAYLAYRRWGPTGDEGATSPGKTVEEIERNIREANEMHFEGMAEDGEPIPEPSTLTREVEINLGADAA